MSVPVYMPQKKRWLTKKENNSVIDQNLAAEV